VFLVLVVLSIHIGNFQIYWCYRPWLKVGHGRNFRPHSDLRNEKKLFFCLQGTQTWLQTTRVLKLLFQVAQIEMDKERQPGRRLSVCTVASQKKVGKGRGDEVTTSFISVNF
jgi:hypothetical protein